MRLKLAVVFTALVGLGLIAAPSPAFAQLKDRIEQMRKKQEAQQKEAQAKEARARGKKGKGYAKGQDKK